MSTQSIYKPLFTPHLSYNHPRKTAEEESAKEPYQLPMQMPMMLFTRVNETYSSKQNLRIIQRHLLYLIGLSTNIVNKNISLCDFEYLGQYGKIVKLVVNKSKTYNTNGPNGPSYSCHATFSSIDESSLAILCLDNAIVDNHVLKASYGTTKYCTNFLRNSHCLNKDCLYLHALADDRDIISRDQMNNKDLFANQHIMAIELSNIFNKAKKSKIETLKSKGTIFPNASTVYSKDVVVNYTQKENWGCAKTTNFKVPISIMSLGNLYQRKEKSRFDFSKNSAVDPQYLIQVPEPVSDFLRVNLKKSILLRKEQEDVSQYYFSQFKANEAEDSWASLVTTLDLFSSFDNVTGNQYNSSIKKLEERNDIILVDKFNSV